MKIEKKKEGKENEREINRRIEFRAKAGQKREDKWVIKKEDSTG